MNQKTVRIASFCEEGYGEGQLVFVDGKFITSWSSDDAHFRGEYMEELIVALGGVLVETDATLREVKRHVWV